MTFVRGKRICAALQTALERKGLTGKLHSRFRGAANLDTPLGLVTLLSPGRCLQPYSIVLSEDMDYALLEQGALALCSGGVYMNGSALIAFESAAAVDLHLEPGPIPCPNSAKSIRRYLASAPDEGLCGLALGRVDGPYACLIAPRLEVLRRMVRAGEITAAAVAAERMAGCGPGLTPSSDDLLCGYLALLPSGEKWARMAASVATAAAAATNDISAALLARAGEGYFSEDVLRLISCLRQGAESRELTEALLRVARFGSCSGHDFLTGAYFGVLDACAIGGISLD